MLDEETTKPHEPTRNNVRWNRWFCSGLQYCQMTSVKTMQIKTKTNPGTKWRVWRPHQLVGHPSAAQDPRVTWLLLALPSLERSPSPGCPVVHQGGRPCCEINENHGFINIPRSRKTQQAAFPSPARVSHPTCPLRGSPRSPGGEGCQPHQLQQRRCLDIVLRYLVDTFQTPQLPWKGHLWLLKLSLPILVRKWNLDQNLVSKHFSQTDFCAQNLRHPAQGLLLKQ